ncbi:hypothetical protein DFH11DRAFT_1573124 [Phellopilus nigrolimitatus]|nr:hypothetical protein DFH11DRAFT_1573124 [Phellopilus nigrolimitatus]
MSSCGNPAATDGEALMQGRPKFDRSTDCIKCKVVRGNIVIRHAVYCKNCFFPLVTNKFRRCLDPHVKAGSDSSRRTALKASGDVLIGFSGGLGSTVLLDILTRTYFPSTTDAGGSGGKGGKAHPRNRKMWNKAYVCYVEVCACIPEGHMKERKWGPRIEDAFDSRWWANVNLNKEDLPLRLQNLASQSAEDPVTLLRTYLTSLPTPTAVQSAIATLTRLVLVHTARHLRCSHLALGTSLTSLAVSLINSIAQGGGFNVPEESFEEWRDPSNFGPEVSGGFIVGLERDYPSTVSTIARTCAKLAPKDDASDCCVLCERPTPSGVLDWKSRISIRSVDELKTQHDNVTHLPPSFSFHAETDEVLKPALSISPISPIRSLSPRLCYACHTLLTSKSPRFNADLPREVCLPAWTSARLMEGSSIENAEAGTDAEVWKAKAVSRDEMRSAVGEFLLE